MSFQLVKGRSQVEYYPKKASTAFAMGDLVYFDGSGAIQPADATSGNHIGIIMKTVLSTDSDYAENTKVPVLKIYDDCEFEVPVETGTLTAAMVGNYYDLASADGIDVSAQSKNVVLVTAFINAALARVKINAQAENANVATT